MQRDESSLYTTITVKNRGEVGNRHGMWHPQLFSGKGRTINGYKRVVSPKDKNENKNIRYSNFL